MQNKGIIRLFAILLALACLYYLVFTWKTQGVENDAITYAKNYINKAEVKAAAEQYARSHSDKADASLAKIYLDSVLIAKETAYLDSMKHLPIYNLVVTKFTYEQCKNHEINLGLDLKGGMNVTLEVSVPDIIRKLSGDNQDVPFVTALNNAVKNAGTRDFVTVFGQEYQKINPNGKLASHFQTFELKGKITFNSSNEEVLSFIRTNINEAIETTEKTLRARIDKFGVTQPNIQKQDVSGRILVELPGISDKERARNFLQSSANLEFWECEINGKVLPAFNNANTVLASILNNTNKDTTVKDSALAAKDSITKDSTVKDTSSISSLLNKKDTSSLKQAAKKDTTFENFRKTNPLYGRLMQGDGKNSFVTDQTGKYYNNSPVLGACVVKDTAEINRYLNMPAVKAILPRNVKYIWGKQEKGANYVMLYAIKDSRSDHKAPLSGDIIADARKDVDRDGRRGSPYVVTLSMTADAALKWQDITHKAAALEPKGHVAIVLDNTVFSAPRVDSEIPNGNTVITGSFTNEEADDLASILKAGKLPVRARIVEETVVGPTLGAESIRAGVNSFLIALFIVLLFMAFYYNKAGWVANIALFANVFFIMGVLASLNAVLTLPGIAGIVLTIGLSVDANILIFERVREELALGKSMSLAIKDGFHNAFSSILDSNITTLLLGIILYVYGTGPIQGFATTLIIGILTSLFSAICISRLIFDRWLAKNYTISFSNKMTQNAFKNIRIDFVGKRKLYYVFSTAIIVLGIVFLVKNKGFNLGIDFTGGRTFVVRFDHIHKTDEVKEKLAKVFPDAVTEVKTYGSSNRLKITTTYLIDDHSPDVQNVVSAKLEEGLKGLSGAHYVDETRTVGESISNDIKSKAIWSILFSCLVMFIFIYIRFKKWQYGLGAVAALLHDVLIVLSCYAIFNGILPFSLEIDQHFIAAILTVMGYSMTDTVVVFDRIREYLSGKGKADLEKGERNSFINYALNSTLSRTINTSLTIFFVLLAIFIFGGDTIRGFSFALLIGIVIGTYSSICIATPIVIDFDRGAKK